MFLPLTAVACRRRGSRASRAGVRRAHLDPGHEIVYLRVGKLLALGGHLKIGISVANGCEQQTFLRITRNNGGAGIAALFPAAFPVEFESAFDFAIGRAVAFVTVVGEDRADSVFKKIELGLGRFSGGSSRNG